MFKKPFSFKGRIRRLEYVISHFILLISFIVYLSIQEKIDPSADIFVFSLIPSIWFIIAQRTKRSHDMGNSGLFQFIPFFGIIMAFADGDKGPNKYGLNPKEPNKGLGHKKRINLKLFIPPNKNIWNSLTKIWSWALITALLIVFSVFIFKYTEIPIVMILWFFICCMYSIFILISYKREPLPNDLNYLFYQRLFYCLLVYLNIRLYGFLGNNFELYPYSFLREIALISSFVVITYLIGFLYKSLFVSSQNLINKEELDYTPKTREKNHLFNYARIPYRIISYNRSFN